MEECSEDIGVIILQFNSLESTFFPIVLQGGFEVGGIVRKEAFVGIELAHLHLATDYNGDHVAIIIAVQCVSGVLVFSIVCTYGSGGVVALEHLRSSSNGVTFGGSSFFSGVAIAYGCRDN